MAGEEGLKQGALTFLRLSLFALSSFVNCAVSDDQFHRLLSDPGFRPCAVKVGLWQCYIGWPSCQLTQSPADRAQRCSSVNRWSSPLCSHHRHSCQFSLPYELPSESSSSWRSLSSELFTPRCLSDRLSRVADMPS